MQLSVFHYTSVVMCLCDSVCVLCVFGPQPGMLARGHLAKTPNNVHFVLMVQQQHTTQASHGESKNLNISRF